MRAALMFVAATLAALATACQTPDDKLQAAAITGGSADRGRDMLRAYGCSACHTIGGVPGATGRVGPPLDGIAERAFVAGVLPNTPDNLVRWIMEPRVVDPETAMPNLGVRAADARDMAAYLYTLH
jgi:cytochrome c2